MIAGMCSIVKPKELGGVTAYNMNTGDKVWWVPNGDQMRIVTSTDPIFAGVKLPPVHLPAMARRRSSPPRRW